MNNYQDLIFDSVDVAVITTDIHGRIIRMNPVAERLTGFSDGKSAGRQLESLIHIVNLISGKKYANLAEEIIKTGAASWQDGKAMMIIGNRMDLQITGSATPLYDNEGKANGMMLAFRDITESKRAEEKLKEGETRFRMLFENMPLQGVIYRLIRDEKDQIVDWEISFINSLGAESIGMKPEEAFGRSAVNLFGAEVMAPYIETSRRIAETNQSIQFETHFDSNGRDYLASDFMAGEEHYANIALDITEVKKAQAEIESLSLFPAENPNPVLRISNDGVILFTNPAGHPILSEWGCAVGEPAPQFWQEQINEVSLNNKNKQIEFTCCEITYMANIVVIPERGYTNLYLSNITERKQAEKRIHHLNRLYNTLSQINQTIVHTDEQDVLFREICNVAIRFGQYRMAWIGLIKENSNEIEPVAIAGETNDFTDIILSGYPGEEYGNSITATAIRENSCVIVQDIRTNPQSQDWCTHALNCGYLSAASVPLNLSGKVIGALTVYDAEAGTFDDEQFSLLTEIGYDISFALDRFELQSENKRSLEALRESQEKLIELNSTLEERIKERTARVQDLYDNAPVGYHSLDIDGRFTAINQTEIDWLGYTRDEILSQPMTMILAPESIEVFNQNFPYFKITGNLLDTEFNIVRKDGSRFYAIANAIAIYDDEGRYVASRSTLIDISSRKKAENALKNANSELEHAMQFRDQFLASMSHELRTPLNAILGNAEILTRQFYGQVNERQLHFLHTIEKSGHHLLDLITDILDMSKLEAKQMSLDLAPVVLVEICEASLLFIRESAKKKNIRLTSSFDPQIDIIVADGRRLKQILINLLNNAVKFTPEGGSVELTVKADTINDLVSFTVSDTGIGIAPENFQHLFKPFVQLNSGLNRQYDGSGLGLSLVERMIKLHGGRIFVESEVGKGSRFTIFLPWKVTNRPVASPFNRDYEQNDIEQNFSGDENAPLILVVDDNVEILEVVSEFLVITGYRNAVAKNGVEALEQVDLQPPSLILMDIQMPVMDGLETIRRLRANANPQIAAIPVIALTALAMPGDREQALEAGANDYLSKPVSLSTLSGRIRKLLKEAGSG